MTPALQALADHLSSRLDPLLGTTPTTAHLAAALASAPPLEGVLALARFADHAYVRLPLLRTDAYEVRLLCWQTGQSSPLHGHGASACAFRVLAGTATEARTDGAVHTVRAGGIAEAGHDVVHQVANHGSEGLVSLHVYAPPLPLDPPWTGPVRRVLILGGGWCGTALAIHLLRSGDPGLRLTLVESGPLLARGVAFGAAQPEHLLNVPASDMSLDPAQPDDFLAYARALDPKVHADTLVPRRFCGDYVHARLDEAIAASPATLRLARAEATAVRRDGGGWQVTLEDGRVLAADDVVLATGHGPARVPEAFAPLAHHPAVVVDPWAPGALDAVPDEGPVLLLGTGLTALDVLVTLRRRGVRGPIHAVSRNGRWPRPHLPEVTWKGAPVALSLEGAPHTADGLAAWLRARVDEATGQGLPWQAVMQAVRPLAAGLWARLDDAERGRFLSHHRADWEIVRHRIPASAWAQLRAWAAEGWLRTRAGGVQAAEAVGDTLRVNLTEGPLEVHHVVLATGQEADPRRFTAPLWRGLLADRLAVVDVHGLGVRTDDEGALVDEAGARTGLWALGGLRRPRWFDATAVPDLSRQVAGLARVLAAR